MEAGTEAWRMTPNKQVADRTLIGNISQRPRPGKRGWRFISLDERTSYTDNGTEWVREGQAAANEADDNALVYALTLGG